ncbi:hypothetical protein ScPMuIL_006531 [Solemya velum]
MATDCHPKHIMSSAILWNALLLLLMQTTLTSGEQKHVSAFFQGDCSAKPCHHKCWDIDNGYFCECHPGFTLNKDGFTCSALASPVSAIPKNGTTDPEYSVIHSQSSIHAVQESDHLLSDTDSQKRTSLLSNSAVDSVQNVNTKSGALDPRSHKNNIKIRKAFLKKDPSGLIVLSLRQRPGSKIKYKSAYLAGEKATDSEDKKRVCDLICVNNGTCTIDGNIKRCDCPLGTQGEFCENFVEVRYPKFSGTGFLALPVLKTGYKEFDIDIEFRPWAKNGLLLFSADHPSSQSDFFSIILVNGLIEFRFDCGTGIGIIRSKGEVNLGHWNRVHIDRVDNEATLLLNDDAPVHGVAKGAYSRITLRLHVYLGGYSKLGSLSNRVGTHKGFVGCIQEVKINGFQYDMRKSALVGDAEFGRNVGECSEGICEDVICENEGTCLAVAADRHLCMCPLGYGGQNCQHVTEVHIPEFAGHSHLRFQGLGRSVLSFTEIEIVLKPTEANGVVLYNGYKENRQGDFLSIALVGGHIEFRFDLGTGAAVIRSEKALELGEWHWVRASRTGLQGTLEVDEQTTIEGTSEGAFTQLTLLQDLYLGGHPNFDQTSKYSNISQSFTGCIQKVIINSQPLKLLEENLGGINIEACQHPCVGSPCLNGGDCIPDKNIYTCYCPIGYSNTNCEDRIPGEITTPRFTGDSFLMYTDKKVTTRVAGSKMDIHMMIKPESQNGLIFWSGQDQVSPSSDYVALGLIDGALQFRYNLGSGEAVISYNDTKLFDRQWHSVRAQRDRQDAFLEVDHTEIVEGSSSGSYKVLNTNKIVYIGGMPDISQTTGKKFTLGYVGCVRDITLAEEYDMEIVSGAQSGRNILHCL